MTLLLLAEVRRFHEGGGRTSFLQRRDLMLASLSPAARKMALITEGLSIGSVCFRNIGTEMKIEIAAEVPPVPIGWWCYTGTATVEAHNAPLGACAIISAIKTLWPMCTVTRIALAHDDEVSALAQRKILKTLNSLQNEVLSLYLGKLHSENNDFDLSLTALHTLFLEGCDGGIEKWVRALSAVTERVEITDCFSFPDTAFATNSAVALRRLVLDNTNVSVSCLGQLKCADSLQTLSLMDCRKIDTLEIGAFPELRVLLLGRTPIASESLKGAQRCVHLRIVNLGGCQGISDVNVLGALKELRELFLHETCVTNSGIAALASCERLEKINLGGCIYISDVNHLGGLPNLLELHLWNTKVTNSGISGLGLCCSLVELVLDNCIRITDVSSLRHLHSIRWLSLIGTEVDGRGVRELLHCQKLETLALGGTRIDHPPKLWRHEAIVEYLESLA
ncbi:hypothetical protein JKF63_01602 [Porcisia hertigi]|uniref:Uncharacterized protein n=1 Tax=Porcisia hertigi TaxID=2761500 RepID=A0A836HZQ6_9TRYP|nr:hypothetical protein JKF63_01602 [Porcisia hertigi]